MYNELYKAWKNEIESSELQALPFDFYSKIGGYLRQLREEERMLDKKTVKARLLKSETRNVKRMLRELIKKRYEKLILKAAKDDKVPSDVLTAEEAEVFASCLPILKAYRNFVNNLLAGQVLKINVKQERTRVALRFLKEVPEIIGTDMKTYGPFKVEDVASVALENAKILVKQGLAEKVEAN